MSSPHGVALVAPAAGRVEGTVAVVDEPGPTVMDGVCEAVGLSVGVLEGVVVGVEDSSGTGVEAWAPTGAA